MEMNLGMPVNKRKTVCKVLPARALEGFYTAGV